MIKLTSATIALCVPLTIRSEGLRLRPYQNAHDVPTIGYGHTKGVTMKTPPCSIAQAQAWLAADLADAGQDIATHVTHVLTNHQAAALLDFIFNLGAYNFNTSTLLKDINSNKLDDVKNQFPRWVHDSAGEVLSGLVTRRKAELDLWNTPD